MRIRYRIEEINKIRLENFKKLDKLKEIENENFELYKEISKLCEKKAKRLIKKHAIVYVVEVKDKKGKTYIKAVCTTNENAVDFVNLYCKGEETHIYSDIASDKYIIYLTNDYEEKYIRWE